MYTTKTDYFSYIKDHVSIPDVCRKLDIFVRPSGNRYICQCPKHSDKHPSLTIYTQANTYHCFQCGDSGDVFRFIMAHKDWDFHKALSWIEQNFPEVKEKMPDSKARQSMHFNENGYDIAWNIYKQMSEEETEKLRQFALERNYKQKQLELAEVVYAKGRKLSGQVSKGDEFLEERFLLEEKAMIQKVPMDRHTYTDRYEDYFRRDRVIIPLRDLTGKLMGFAGRALEKRDNPKYLFTKDLKKGEFLYRLCNVIDSRKKKESVKLCLVEGIFDAIRLESRGQFAAAVLGSHLTQNQVKVLEKCVKENGVNITSICVFMDGDRAGVDGNYRTVRNILKSSVLRNIPVTVRVLKTQYMDDYKKKNEKECKDPDEYYSRHTLENREGVEDYTVYEYLFRYFLKKDDLPLDEIDIKTEFQKRSSEEKISILNRIQNMMSYEEWKEYFSFWDLIGKEKADDILLDSWVKSYVLGRAAEHVGTYADPVAFNYHMQNALQMVKTSYSKEEIKLDDWTWDRIASSADVFYPYLYHSLGKGSSLKQPLVRMMIPKKRDEQRPKSMYLHEQLLLQQYVLNELLSRGSDAKYEKYIPAVRYSAERGSCYMTGYDYMSCSVQPVSFAYQIDMDVVNGTKQAVKGMFRDYYECWKDYILYIQNGVKLLDGNKVYRVKLDISGFYDHITKYIVRDALYPQLVEALRTDDKKFAAFFGDTPDDKDVIAQRVVDWLLDQLFEDRYYQPSDGALAYKPDKNTGIPQGPNLSAYIASVILFPLDKKVQKRIDEINDPENNGENIKIRYCRYVDDMVIVSSNPKYLLEIKDMIQSWLYEAGFELSSKTDAADAISKEDAILWTVDESGGLGVSVGFDFPDDSIDFILDEYSDLECTDRRTLLKILHGVLHNVLYEGVPADEQNFEQLCNVVFQTESIRLRDIVRFSELMLRKAAKEDTDIFSAFQKIWDSAQRECLSDSLLLTEGISFYVFLQGCESVLSRLKKIPNGDGYELWIETKKKIEEWFLQQSSINVCMERIANSEILRANQAMLQIQIMKIKILLNQEYSAHISGNMEYYVRWKWLAEKERTGKISAQLAKDSTYVQWFHWMLIQLNQAKEKTDIEEIFSRVSNYLNYWKNENNMLCDCMVIWSTEKTRQEYAEYIVRASLFTMLNILPRKFRAEYIGNKRLYRKILFSGNPEILSVFPGTETPGIMALEKSGEDNDIVSGALRCDFTNIGVEVEDAKQWSETKSEEELQENDNICFYKRELPGSYRYTTLQDYVKVYGIDTVEEVLRVIVKVYPALYSEILEQMKKYSDKRQIFSGENVLLGCEGDRKEIKKIELGITYLISDRLIADVVGVRQKDGTYRLRHVDAEGAPFWIAGNLLEDVCEFETHLLSEEGEQGTDMARNREMLSYVAKRITGQQSRKTARTHRTEHSYRSSVKRMLDNLEGYLKQTDKRDIYLENAKIENAFISYRMSMKDKSPGDARMAIWAKRYICIYYKRLIDIAGQCNEKILSDCLAEESRLKRRVSGWYELFGARLYAIYRENKKWLGIRTLAKALWADAVLMNLRMQVLEFVQTLNEEQREQYRKSYHEMPMEALDIRDDTVFAIQNRDWHKIWDDLLQGENIRDIKYLTHLGWVGIFGMLLEMDRPGNRIYRLDPDMRNKAVHALRNVAYLLSPDPNEGEGSFPYEEMDTFFDLWIPQKMQKLTHNMNQIDEALGFCVELTDTEFFTMKSAKNQIEVQVEGEVYKKPVCFVTYSKKENDGLDSYERNIQNRDQTRFTCTRRSGKILGISMVAGSFGDAFQLWQSGISSIAEETEIPGTPEIRESSESIDDKDQQANPPESTDDKDQRMNPPESIDDKAQTTNPSESTDDKDQRMNPPESTDNVGAVDDSGLKKRISDLHGNNWKQRKKPFRELDRIALFQFEIDSSYLPPKEEVRDILKEREQHETDLYYPSFAEFRRRKLLEPVLKACEDFGVEILLLPEYSVRPETVEWMCQHIKEKGYTFSVWAGTFKIPAGYRFESKYWESPTKEELSGKMYWHSAPLPVIINDKDGTQRNISIVARKFKKYPAVALKEELNPVPAINAEKGMESFRPVMEKEKGADWVRNLTDARRDVTELICAETFVIFNITNYPSFLQASRELRNIYRTEEDKYDSYETYKKTMLADIVRFGNYTAMFSENYSEKEERGWRKSIVLIPACSTRAADYYVIGQGNYLASGLKTVFCNSVDKASRGGSCFIGQNSWDDTKRRGCNSKEEQKIRDLLSENTYYHGLNPGIYQQTSPYDDRGALGREEQALLICDMQTNEKSNPTTESTISSLSVVAHIPILEYKTTKKDYEQDNLQAACRDCKRQKTRSCLESLVDICKNQAYRSTMEDRRAKEGQNNLRILGELYHSDWLIQRGDYYEEYHVLKPQMWPAPTLIDWIYVETDYGEFKTEISAKDYDGQYNIQVPDEEASPHEL